VAGGAVAAAVAVALLPFLGPLLEIYLFSRKSAEAIEDTVRIKTSLQVPTFSPLHFSRSPGSDILICFLSSLCSFSLYDHDLQYRMV